MELSGEITRIIGNTTQQNRYSITINSSLVGLNSDETSEKTYYGLFTLIGKNANISNLTINYNKKDLKVFNLLSFSVYSYFK